MSDGTTRTALQEAVRVFFKQVVSSGIRWKTRLTVKAGEGGSVKFRGFKGKYRVSWTDASGAAKSAEFALNKDGDGL